MYHVHTVGLDFIQILIQEIMIVLEDKELTRHQVQVVSQK